MKPEFLALKYIGVPTVEKLKENAKSYGWKCRKYSRWKQVHIEPDDASILHEMGTSLIDEGEVDCAVYARVSEIWLRVQRWRFDKDKLEIDPPKNEAWERMKVGVQVAIEYPHSIVSFLFSRGVKNELNAYSGCMLFLLHHLSDLLQDIGIKPVNEFSDLVQTNSFSKESLDSVLTALVDRLYGEQCVSTSTARQGVDLINQVLMDLGIDTFVFPDNLPYSDVEVDEEPSVIVEYAMLERDKAIDIKTTKGKTIVILNEHHIGIQNMMGISGQNAIEILFAAIGETVNDMPSKEKVLNDFLALFSLHLIQLSSGGVLSTHSHVNQD